MHLKCSYKSASNRVFGLEQVTNLISELDSVKEARREAEGRAGALASELEALKGGGVCGGVAVKVLEGQVAPYTLHPTSYTLHPTPYTLHPTPYTLHPSLCTRNPQNPAP